MPFTIIRNDITKVNADAIVNTANPRPVIGSGTDSAVYKAAGEKLYIPIKNAESLNAGVAASIICWEMTKQQAADKLHSAQEQCN